MRYIQLVLSGVVASALAAPAFATSCDVTDISPTAMQCSGGYAGNVLDNNAGDVLTQQEGLLALGFVWDGTHFGDLPKLSSLGGETTIDFPGMLHGITYFGIHVGGPHGGQTTFYKFSAGEILDTFSIHLASSSDAVLYYSAPAAAVPEPATWAMLVGGFAAVGGAMRSRRRATASFG